MEIGFYTMYIFILNDFKWILFVLLNCQSNQMNNLPTKESRDILTHVYNTHSNDISYKMSDDI